MTKVGRRRSVVWECFEEHPTSGKRRVVCRFCGHDTVANPIRMVRHIVRNCLQATDEHRRICQEYESLSVPARRSEVASAAMAAAATGAAGSKSERSVSRAARPASVASVTPDAGSGGEQPTPQLTLQQANSRRHTLSGPLGVGAAPHQVQSVRTGSPVIVVDSGEANQPQQFKQQPASSAAITRHDAHQWPAQLRQRGDAAMFDAKSGSSSLSPALSQSIVEELVLALLAQSDVSTAAAGAPSWSLLENAHFRLALQRLRPEFRVPSTKTVRRSVLPKLHATARTAIDQFIKSASSLTVLCSTEIAADHTQIARWLAVDQDNRCELLGVSSSAATEYPEEMAKRIRAFIQEQIPRVTAGGSAPYQKQPFMVHFCSDSVGAGQVARGLLKKPTPAPAGVNVGSSSLPMLVGGCMMQQTLLLFRDTLETITCVSLALDKCMEVASFINNCKPLLRDLQAAVAIDTVDQPRRRRHFEIETPTPESFHSFLVCVSQVLALKDAIQRVLAKHTAMVDSDEVQEPASASYLDASNPRARAFMEVVNDEMFWLCLEFTKQVLAPFASLLVLSDSGHTTSSQLLLCWLMLQHTINVSSLVLESDKESFGMVFVDRIRMFSEDHVFACLIVDPRVHGLSLSAQGKRKARLIIADLGAKLAPGMNRQKLVEQLLKFLNRERPFDEDDSWTMMASMPRLFWLEYLEEMPELAIVALAVLGFHSHLMPLEETWKTHVQRQRRRGHGGNSSSQEIASDTPVVSLELEQIKVHFRKAPSSADDARTQSLLKYRKCVVRASLAQSTAGLEALFADDGDADRSSVSTAAPMANAPASEGLSSDSQELSGDGDSNGSSLKSGASADEAPLALRQLKSWLQRFGEQEKSIAVDSAVVREAADGLLQRFDAGWLDLSVESAQRVRVCVEKFVFGSEEADADGGNAETGGLGGAASSSVDSEKIENGRQQQQERSGHGRSESDGGEDNDEPMNHAHEPTGVGSSANKRRSGGSRQDVV